MNWKAIPQNPPRWANPDIWTMSCALSFVLLPIVAFYLLSCIVLAVGAKLDHQDAHLLFRLAPIGLAIVVLTACPFAVLGLTIGTLIRSFDRRDPPSWQDATQLGALGVGALWAGTFFACAVGCGAAAVDFGLVLASDAAQIDVAAVVGKGNAMLAQFFDITLPKAETISKIALFGSLATFSLIGAIMTAIPVAMVCCGALVLAREQLSAPASNDEIKNGLRCLGTIVGVVAADLVLRADYPMALIVYGLPIAIAICFFRDRNTPADRVYVAVLIGLGLSAWWSFPFAIVNVMVVATAAAVTAMTYRVALQIPYTDPKSIVNSGS